MSSREKFEQAIKSRFGDSIDYRVCKNSDGEYMAWDMQVAWWAWQAAEADMAVQLANAESKCRELAAENAALKEVVSGVNSELYGQGFEVSGWHLNGALEPLDNWFTDNGWGMPETPATDAFLTEVRAQGVEMYADNLDSGAEDAERDGFDDAVKFLRSEASGVRLFAAQLRKGDKS
ncbi:TPA: hypothetical protein ACGQTC_001654 [Citrobacter braakii]|uniref:hypothetical protein n=2 Tax=Enterobacteriaceae TaxID=543 RepID=UPI002065A4E4|nr:MULTISPECIES: hypothetical protein [Citrobacter]MDM3329165.1 hypothetical protein [Citrobacter sp. Cb130]WFW79989.1 hypothetical protein NFJ83_11000 [Citrobacter braakii]DAX09208.1 MAG TPA: hypothetical protein [Bacteriophage sp.]